MSYSLNEKCGSCRKFDKCVDYHVLRGAVDTIHALFMKQHMGGGSIDLNCSNFEPKE